MTKLRHRLGFNLTDAFARHSVDLTDFIKSLRLSISKTKTHRDDASFTLRKGVEDSVQLLLKQGERHGICRNDSLRILNQIAELAITVLTKRSMQRNRLTSILLNLDNLFRGHVQFFSKLFRSGFTTEILKHLTLDTSKLINHFDHVDGDANSSCLVCHRARNRLTNPPGRVG